MWTDFAEARLQKVGFPKFDDSEIIGDEVSGSIVLEILYPGFGDEPPEVLRFVSAEVTRMVSAEMSLVSSSVSVWFSCLPHVHHSSWTSLVSSESHVRAYLKDNSWMGTLQLSRDEAFVVRNKCVLVKCSTNLALQHEHKNRLCGQLARVLLRNLASHWTGEVLECIFTHDGSRRVWKAPVQHSDKFGAK